MADPTRGIMQLRQRAILRGRFLDCTPTFVAMRWRLDTCPNCGAVLAWLSDDGRGVGECDRCAYYGTHGGGCQHAAEGAKQ